MNRRFSFPPSLRIDDLCPEPLVITSSGVPPPPVSFPCFRTAFFPPPLLSLSLPFIGFFIFLSTNRNAYFPRSRHSLSLHSPQLKIFPPFPSSAPWKFGPSPGELQVIWHTFYAVRPFQFLPAFPPCFMKPCSFSLSHLGRFLRTRLSRLRRYSDSPSVPFFLHRNASFLFLSFRESLFFLL